VGRWLHAHEEDTDDVMVFRPADADLPPARGREGLALDRDGSAAELTPGADDRPTESSGRWALTDAGTLVVDGPGGRRALQVLTAEPGALVVRETDPEDGAGTGAHGGCRAAHPGARVAPATVRMTAAGRRDPRVAAVVDGVDAPSGERIAADVADLAARGTRHSESAEYSAALAWAEDRLRGLGYICRREAVATAVVTTENLVAEHPSAAPGSDLVVVGAHLDSINIDGGPTAPAPGADDNASGSAGLLEIARVLAGEACPGLRLVLFGGEEEGLHGSRAHVAGLSADERGRLVGMVNMDMIGVRNTVAPTVLLEGAELSRPLVDALAAAAATYTDLVVTTSFHPYASDHVPFLDAGLPAVLTIEGDDTANTNVHTPADVPGTVDPALAARIVAMNVATVLGLHSGARPG
jgi:hypothetical protein